MIFHISSRNIKVMFSFKEEQKVEAKGDSKVTSKGTVNLNSTYCTALRRVISGGLCNMLFGETKLGKFGETISEKVLETVFLGSKTGKNSDFLRSQFASDSVIRWFESSYPSHFGIIRTSSLSERRSDYFYY